MIAEPVTPSIGRCDRCGHHRDQLHRDALGYVCRRCCVGNPENPVGRPGDVYAKRGPMGERVDVVLVPGVGE